MKPEIKKLWVDALRSGEYEQGHDSLCQVNPEDETAKAFCCLGVLTDLYQKHSAAPLKSMINSQSYMVYKDVDEFEYYGMLPISVLAWAGLSHYVVNNVNYNDGITALWSLNDSDRLNFNQIANIIEEQL